MQVKPPGQTSAPQFWEAVFERLGEAATVFRGDGRAVAVNTACCALFGYSRAGFADPSFNWLDRFDKADLPRIGGEIGKLANGSAQLVYYEAAMTTKDGSRLWIGNTDTSLGVLPGQGEESLFLCLMTNETKRRAELLQRLDIYKTELLQARDIWHALLERLPFPVAGMDASGRRLFMNRYSQAMIGSVQGDHVVLDQEGQGRFLALLQQSDPDRSTIDGFCIKHPQHGALPVVCTVVRLPEDMQHNLDFDYLVALVDIGALKAREREMEEQRLYFRELFDSVPLAIVVRDSHGHVHDANKAHAKPLGVTMEELLSPGFSQFAFTPP